MTTIVEFDKLLAPISEERPCGIDIRDDESPTSIYYQLKDARNAARADERNQAAKPEADRTESKQWNTIMELAPRVLAEQTKDLEVAAWYAEALLRKHGMAGLRDGLQLINELASQYWNNLFPQTDDAEEKAAPLAGLFGLNSAGSLVQPLNCIAITDPKQEPKFSAWQYQQAVNLAKAPDAKARNERIKGGVPTLQDLEKAAAKTSAAFYQTLLENTEATKAAFNTLFATLEQHCGEAVPNGSFVRSALNNAQTAIKAIAKDKLAPAPDDVIDTPTAEVADSSDALFNLPTASMAGALAGNTLQQRAEAFATLRTIADFFRKTEPHSPISYAIERILKWGDMQLPELLKELIANPDAFQAYCKLTGVELAQPAPMPMQQQNGGYPNQPYNGYNDPMGMPNHNPMGGGYDNYSQPATPGYNPAPMGDPLFNNSF